MFIHTTPISAGFFLIFFYVHLKRRIKQVCRHDNSDDMRDLR